MRKMTYQLAVFLFMAVAIFSGCDSEENFAPNNFNFNPNPNPETLGFIVPPSGFLTELPGTSHQVMILGLKTDREYSIEITAPNTNDTFIITDAKLETPQTDLAKLLTFETNSSVIPQVRVVPGKSNSLASEITFRTEPLPEGFPPMQVLESQPTRMAPGYTMFNVRGNSYVDPYMIAVDAMGEVVWYYQLRMNEIARIQSGNLMICDNEHFIREMDMLGNIVRNITNTQINEPRIHHDCTELPNKNIVTMSGDLRNIGPYPPNNEYYNVVGDVIVEFDENLNIVSRFSMHDTLDPFRVIPGFNAGFWNGTFGMPTKDWTHGNAVSHDPSDDTWLVSLRHQNLVGKFAKNGDLIWVIAEDDPSTSGDDNWPFLELIGPGSYPDHQHAVELTPYGDIIIYDNANNSTGMSRPVIYRVDEQNLTMTQQWEWFDPTRNPPICAPFVGDADYLVNDNVLIGHMGVADSSGPCEIGNNYVLIVEVDVLTGDKVFELEVRHPLQGFNGYRAERLADLYPPN